MNDVSVERPTPVDVDAIADLWVELAAGQRQYGAHLLAAANHGPARMFLAQALADERVRVARDEDGLVGFVNFHVETGAYDQDVVRGVIDNVFVEPDHRGRGVGSRLLDAAEDALDESDVDVYSLSVMAANDRARSLYERRGYEPHRLTLERPAGTDTNSKDGGE